MTTEEWFICIGLGGLLLLAVGAFFYSRCHTGKNDEFAVGRKSDNGSRPAHRGQLYTFTTPDGKTYTASLSSDRAKIKGFLNFEYPDEVLIRYNKNDPTKHVVLKKKK